MKYTENNHLLPLRKMAKITGFDKEELNIENQDTFIKDFLKHLFENTNDLPSPYQGFSRFLYYNVLSKKILETCPEMLIGKWAYFPDIEMQIGFQESFGQIVALRNTKSWEGYKYYIKRPNQKTCMEISNATLCAFDLDIDGMDFTVNDDNLQNIFNSLNMFGQFMINDQWIEGKLRSFDDKVFTIVDLKDQKEYNIPSCDFNEKSKNLCDNISSLSFSMTITKSQ